MSDEDLFGEQYISESSSEGDDYGGPPMPSVFIGHGNPMFVLGPNEWTNSWSQYALTFNRPKAILAISAHWFKKSTMVTLANASRLIYDFYGFPQELYEVEYLVSGSTWLTNKLLAMLGEFDIYGAEEWGIDHGTWTVLKHMYPNADIPVVQLSINYTLDIHQHLKIGQVLKELRKQGVLILGSGNVVHNLREARFELGFNDPYAYTVDFDLKVDELLKKRDLFGLTDILNSKEGRLSAPTIEHYVPLLYTLGASNDDDEFTTICQGYDAGSLSMRAISFG